MEIDEVQRLIISGSIGIMTFRTIDIKRTKEGCSVLLKSGGLQDIWLNKEATYLNEIAQRLLDAEVLKTQDFEDLWGMRLDGTTYSFEIFTKNTTESRNYYCPEESKDPRIHLVCSIIDDVIREYDPPEWKEQIRQLNEKFEKEHQEQIDNTRKALENRKTLAIELLKKLEERGLKCPHCGKQSKNLKYYESQAYFVCQKCGRSSSPDLFCNNA